MTEIYNRIQQLCRTKGINVTFLCSACGISRASLSDYKSGRKKTLSASTLAKIAEYFGVSVDYLYGGETAPLDNNSLKVALFGGSENIDDEMLNEVKQYAKFIMERRNENK